MISVIGIVIIISSLGKSLKMLASKKNVRKQSERKKREVDYSVNPKLPKLHQKKTVENNFSSYHLQPPAKNSSEYIGLGGKEAKFLIT